MIVLLCIESVAEKYGVNNAYLLAGTELLFDVFLMELESPANGN